jgi:predicted HAD superfamily Cof-like phosphohydrolase
MTKLQHQVLEFHRVFDHPVADSPTIPPEKRVRFRARFIVEECLEFLEACIIDNDGNLSVIREYLQDYINNSPVAVNLADAVDALADIDYVVEGTRLEFGINGEPIADEVHRANMAKLHDGKVIKRADGKTLKPPGWKPPDITGELERQRRGFGSLSHARNYNALKAAVMTDQHKAEQRLDFAYGNLAIDGKASRSAFRQIALAPLIPCCGWTEEQFNTWAAKKEWAPE